MNKDKTKKLLICTQCKSFIRKSKVGIFRYCKCRFFTPEETKILINRSILKIVKATKKPLPLS